MDSISPIMGKAFLSVSGVDKMKASAKGGVINFNGQKLPASTDLFALFSKLPTAQKNKITEDMNKKFTSLGDKMVNQAAAGSVKTEYKALGMNTGDLQSSYIITRGAYMLLVSLVSAFCTIVVGFLASRAAAGLSRNLRKKHIYKGRELFK